MSSAHGSEADDDALGKLLSIADPSIEALDRGPREAIGEVWQKRAESELVVRAEFVLIRKGFGDLESNPALDHALARAVADEARHSRICAAVAQRYTGVPVTSEERKSEPLARFGNADETISLLLHLVLLSSINEVTSTFYLRDAMKHCRAELARLALRELLSDDVEHARIGWAYLASSRVTAEAKHHVASALPTLLRLSREAWTRVRANDKAWFRDHGCPGQAVARSAFERAVPEVILPGMAAVGIDPEPGARWFGENVAR